MKDMEELSQDDIDFPKLTQEEKEEYGEDVLRIVKNVYKKELNRNPLLWNVSIATRDIMFSILLERAVKSLNSYRHNKGFKVTTHIYRCTKQGISEFYDTHINAKRKNLSYEMFPLAHFDDPLFPDWILNSLREKVMPLDVVMENEEIKNKKDLILRTSLTEKELLVIKERFKGTVLSEIGESLGVSRARAGQIEKKAISKIQKQIELEGFKNEDSVE